MRKRKRKAVKQRTQINLRKQTGWNVVRIECLKIGKASTLWIDIVTTSSLFSILWSKYSGLCFRVSPVPPRSGFVWSQVSWSFLNTVSRVRWENTIYINKNIHTSTSVNLLTSFYKQLENLNISLWRGIGYRAPKCNLTCFKKSFVPTNIF